MGGCTRSTRTCDECGRDICPRCGRCYHRAPADPMAGTFYQYCPSTWCRLRSRIPLL